MVNTVKLKNGKTTILEKQQRRRGEEAMGVKKGQIYRKSAILIFFAEIFQLLQK